MTPEPVQLAPEIEALVLATAAKRIAERTTLVKALVGQRYADGHREIVRSPLDGTRLGQVYRTSPEPKWVVTDPDALDAELRSYPGNVETTVEIVGDRAEVLAVLATHAPHLLEDVTHVRDGIVAAALAQSAATGTPAAAGIAQVTPSGVLTVKPDAKAGAAVERLVQAGVITWDGRPALPSGDEAEEVPARVQAAEERREMRDLIDRSSLGEHVREVGTSGFAACHCGQWKQGTWAEHLADAAAQDMGLRR